MTQPTTQQKILAVDDNPTNLKILGTLLKADGYQVGFAMNGRQAIEVLEEMSDFDLVLLDINMPDINGFETLKIIKKSNTCSHIPVIMLTAYSSIENVIQCLEGGAVDYITKPFNSKELLSRVKTQAQLKTQSDQIKAFAREMEQANATKDKFFSIISHDLRNPIGAMQIVSKMLKSSIAKNKPEQTKELLQLLDQTIDAEYKLLDNLLHWARSQTGRIKVSSMELYIANITDEVMKVVAPQAAGKNIEFFNEINDSHVAYADAELLKTILRNLITNAVKYCNPNEGKIWVNSTTEANLVKITVRDNGIGMDADTQNRLFRIDGNITSRPGTQKEEGTGLGLILCHEFAEKMNGTIAVKSTPDQGSTFMLTLPVNEL